MPHAIPAPTILAIGLLLTPALAEETTPATFLAEARARHLDHTAAGLTSLAAQMTMRRSEAESMRNYKDMAGFGYAWTAPDAESFDFSKTYESLHQPIRVAIRGLYREVSGGLWFDFLSSLSDTTLVAEDSTFVLAGTNDISGPVRATFSKDDMALESVAFPRARTTFAYGHAATPEGLRVEWREMVAGDAAAVRTSYRVMRRVNGLMLPTVIELRSEKSVSEFGIEYLRINDSTASCEAPAAEEIEQRVAAFGKAWRSWGEEQKVIEIRALAELADDSASAAIANLGLKHAAGNVRREAAETLGVMRRANAVRPLLAAMKSNDDRIEIYLAIVRALGEIGDPHAIDALSKDWWNQRIGEDGIAAARAKISALGSIRHPKAVDALIDTFFMARAETLSRLQPDVVLALGKLTGQDIGNDPRSWKEWWKRSRARFRFD